MKQFISREPNNKIKPDEYGNDSIIAYYVSDGIGPAILQFRDGKAGFKYLKHTQNSLKFTRPTKTQAIEAAVSECRDVYQFEDWVEFANWLSNINVT
jgi:hypothetical protein